MTKPEHVNRIRYPSPNRLGLAAMLPPYYGKPINTPSGRRWAGPAT